MKLNFFVQCFNDRIRYETKQKVTLNKKNFDCSRFVVRFEGENLGQFKLESSQIVENWKESNLGWKRKRNTFQLEENIKIVTMIEFISFI